jgi:TRAP-type C4-dicarboxylate transport system permease small subunit
MTPRAAAGAPSGFDWALIRLDAACRVLSAVGVLALVVMMLATVADVVLRRSLNLPIKGVYDLVESTLVVVVFLGVPRCFLRERQITVDIVDGLVSPAVLGWIKFIASLLGLCFLIMLFCTMIGPALDSYRFNDHKPDMPIPLFALWLVMFVGVAATISVMACLALRDFVVALRRRSVA